MLSSIKWLQRKPPIRSDLKVWITEQNRDAKIFREINGSYLPKCSPALDIFNRAIEFPYHHELRRGVNERYLATIKDTVLHSEGILELPDNSFALETAWIESNLIYHPSYFQRFQAPANYVKGNFFSCLLVWSYGYYHWLSDVLPRFFKVLEILPDDIKFIVPSDMTQWQRISLTRIGIPEEKWIEYNSKRPWKLECLYYVPPVAMTSEHDPLAMRWVADRLAQVKSDKENFIGCSKRLFISRKKARSRRIVNEEELFSFLEDKGFTKIFAEELSFDEQIQVFSNAEAIVAPHGAGLTNMLFSPPHTKILEIFEPSTLRGCYWSMANAMNHIYRCHVGESASFGRKDSDIFVPLNHFARGFRSWFGE